MGERGNISTPRRRERERERKKIYNLKLEERRGAVLGNNPGTSGRSFESVLAPSTPYKSPRAFFMGKPLRGFKYQHRDFFAHRTGTSGRHLVLDRAIVHVCPYFVRRLCCSFVVFQKCAPKVAARCLLIFPQKPYGPLLRFSRWNPAMLALFFALDAAVA